jgi:hypothetical protein
MDRIHTGGPVCLVLAHTALAQDVSGLLDPGAGPTDAHSQMYTL